MSGRGGEDGRAALGGVVAAEAGAKTQAGLETFQAEKARGQGGGDSPAVWRLGHTALETDGADELFFKGSGTGTEAGQREVEAVIIGGDVEFEVGDSPFDLEKHLEGVAQFPHFLMIGGGLAEELVIGQVGGDLERLGRPRNPGVGGPEIRIGSVLPRLPEVEPNGTWSSWHHGGFSGRRIHERAKSEQDPMKSGSADPVVKEGPARPGAIGGTGSAYGSRTRVPAVRGRCPRPLDERAVQWN